MGNVFIWLKLATSRKDGLGEGLLLLPLEPPASSLEAARASCCLCAFLEHAVRVEAHALACSFLPEWHSMHVAPTLSALLTEKYLRAVANTNI